MEIVARLCGSILNCPDSSIKSHKALAGTKIDDSARFIRENMNTKALLEMHDIILERLATERQACRELKNELGLTASALNKLLFRSFEECDRFMCENLSSPLISVAKRFKICDGLLELDREIQLLINGKKETNGENVFEMACAVHESFNELVFEIIMIAMLQEYPQSLVSSPVPSRLHSTG